VHHNPVVILDAKTGMTETGMKNPPRSGLIYRQKDKKDENFINSSGYRSKTKPFLIHEFKKKK